MSAERKLNFAILDSIRGIAALYVTAFHCKATLFIGGFEYVKKYPLTTFSWDTFVLLIMRFFTLGFEFVIVFFVLSGFCIAHSIMHSKTLSGFFIRRLVRIYPPYVAAIGYALIVFWITLKAHPDWYNCEQSGIVYTYLCNSIEFASFHTVVNNLLYNNSGIFIAQFWSLPHELLFYVSIPLTCFLFEKNRVTGLWCFVLFSLAGYIFSLYTTGIYLPDGGADNGLIHLLENFWFTYSIYFSVGILLYLYYGRLYKKFLIARRWILWGVLFFLVMLMSALKFKLGVSSKLSLLLAVITSCLLIVNFQYFNIRLRLFEFIGRFSYTLYVTHVASIYLMACIIGFFVRDISAIYNKYYWLLAIVPCVIIARLLYFLCEYPTLGMLQRMRSDKSAVSQKP